MFDLSGKTALVTGASGGIGGAIARAAARPGRACGAVGHARGGAGRASPSELGERAVDRACDLADAARGGRPGRGGRGRAPATQLDILVSNAGVTRDGLLLRMKDEDWRQVMTVNLESYFRLCRAAPCAA